MPAPMELFPYPEVRPFQDELMQVVFTADAMLASVPTGAGKSVASLCAFLADRMEGEKVVVLTRTKSQAEIFLREAGRISRHAGRLLAVHLHSKQDLCPVFRDEDTTYEEFLELCRLSRCTHRETFRQRVHEIEELGEMGRFPEGELLAYGCPHAVLLELAKHADVVIASYGYLLSPPLRSQFLTKLGLDMGELLVIVDEAHNLHAQEGRSLSRRTVELALRESGEEVLQELLPAFSEEDALLRAGELVSPSEVERLYRTGVEHLRRRLKRGRKVSHTYRVAVFLKGALAAEEEENWIFFRQAQKLHLKPLFPAEHLKPLRQARKVLLMSGTLEPLEMYREVFGFEGAELYSCPPIYSRNVRYLALRSGLSTAMGERERRGEELWESYAGGIEEIHRATPSTTLAFFPSYSIMHSVGRHLNALMEPKSSKRLGEFLQQVKTPGKKLVLGVAGGKLSEGVEYTLPSPEGRRSIVGTVVIAGLPFPAPDFEFEVRRKLYERRYSPPRAYAYLVLLPMINRVLQSAGRAVRSARDRACVVFLDDRLEHLRHLPEHIRHELTPLELEEIVEEVRWFHAH